MSSHLTAIARKKPSAPMRMLSFSGKLRGRCLDYGCGRGLDATTYRMDRYDPHFSPERPEGPYDTITCNYVLNVIEDPAERAEVLRDIASLLSDCGIAYITVRTDKAALRGRTSRGTWQGLVELDLPVEQRGSGFTTYRLEA